jgi:hypothetical protein
MYTHYINGYERSMATINAMRNNTKFQKFLEEERKKNDASLVSYMILPGELASLDCSQACSNQHVNPVPVFCAQCNAFRGTCCF